MYVIASIPFFCLFLFCMLMAVVGDPKRKDDAIVIILRIALFLVSWFFLAAGYGLFTYQ